MLYRVFNHVHRLATRTDQMSKLETLMRKATITSSLKAFFHVGIK